ncbi:hypothetical protein ACQ4WX_50235 [Streptomyces lasalocidi]
MVTVDMPFLVDSVTHSGLSRSTLHSRFPTQRRPSGQLPPCLAPGK